MGGNENALFTVDMQDPPKRAVTDQVNRLIRGEHANGTTSELLDLIRRGEITIPHTEDIANAEIGGATQRRK